MRQIKRMDIKIKTLLILLLFGFALTQPAFAAETVEVTLPAFPVTLNGQTTSNQHSRYPLLVYKDITYFPMTYYDMRLLGLKTEWTRETGLVIEKNEKPFYEYLREVTDETNASSQRAQIAEGAIRVNGTAIDNKQEPYPLLFFRDVTYFPLTWRFAVDEFGWQYTFDPENGLVITNPDAPFETPEPWNGGGDFWGSIMGNGDMLLFFSFGDGVQPFGDQLPHPHFMLHNITGEEIELLPASQTWEYQIYRLIGTNEELVYRRAFPFYSGPIAARHFIFSDIEDTAWKRSVTPGTYRLTVNGPEMFSYRIAGTEQVLQAPVKGDANAWQFPREVTVP